MPEKKLNIIYHFRVRGTGAEGVHIAGIVNGFRAAGHTVRLVSPTNADPIREAQVAAAPTQRHSVKTFLLHKLADLLPQPFFEFMEIGYNFFAIFRLWRAAGRNQVDLIYERYTFLFCRLYLHRKAATVSGSISFFNHFEGTPLGIVII